MKLVSRRDAEFWRTRNMASIRSAADFYRLCATVEAFSPIVEWAAGRNCRNLQEKWPATCGHCETCLARKLDKEAKP